MSKKTIIINLLDTQLEIRFERIEEAHVGGYYKGSDRTICIDESLDDPEILVQAVIHELLHAWGHQAGHKEFFSTTQNTHEEEEFINGIAAFVRNLLKNKHFIKWCWRTLGID